ncbi:MAG: hypothetical protein IIX61_05055 [Loktanella sp.]|nr:hypothetical protein [Loktanella sp.]
MIKSAMFLTAALLGLSLAGPATAATVSCNANIDGQPYQIFYDDSEPYYSSFRERIFSRNTCPGAVVVAFLTPELTPAERQVFCSNYDTRTRSHSMPAQGRRDAYGRCVEPSRTCKLVNTTRDQAMELAGLGREVENPGLTSRLSSTVSTVTHHSGAMIMSGSASTITGLLSSAGAAIGAPTMLAGAAASVVVIGGAVYLCGDDE